MVKPGSLKTAEIKSRTYEEVKKGAMEVYSHWGISLNDAINIFLVKSIEVGGLPFNMRPDTPSYKKIAAKAYKAPLNSEGIPVLPSEWDDDE